ncbi:uncharacterized protein [Linepithema humile]|uniref:uncharacterized protein isoform X2 n=1 Tax=Linepithema humile TaxID=83485 RepID=UPI00351E8BA4
MPITGEVLLTESHHVSSTATGMLRFIDRLSGKRRHVRRSPGPDGGARAAEETQGDQVNDTRYKVGGIGAEEICPPVAKVCCDDSNIINRHYHSPTPHFHHLHHHSHRHSSFRQYHYRRDTNDENDNDGECEDDDNDGIGDGDGDGDGDGNDASNDKNNKDNETCLERFHSRLHQRFYDRRRYCRSDINAQVDVDHVEVHRTETTAVHPFVRTSPIATATTTATTIANPSVITAMAKGCKIPPYLATLLLLSYTLFGIADACSSRSTPKARPPTTTDRPNITFHMYTCPPDYAEWYCLNGATCFTVKIVDSLLYNCLCANGYIGQRCEFKDLDGSYLPSRQRVMLETASIAGGATIAVFLVVIICIAAYIHCKRKQKELRSSTCADTVDGPGRDPELRPFSNRNRSLMIFMAKNPPNSSAMAIEQTRMPGWNSPEAESMRMASISENKHSSQ